MLKIPIKASQVTNLTDARYFAARSVEWLGFSLDSSADTIISPQQIHAIKEWITGPKIVIEFGLHSPEEIHSAVEYLQPDAIQIGMFADPALLRSHVELPIIKEIILEASEFAGLEALLAAQAPVVDYFILDFAKNEVAFGDLDAAQRIRLQKLSAKYQLFFHWSEEVDIIQTFIEQVQPYGLVIVGGEEEKVGFKSFDELDELLDVLEVEEW